MSTVEFSLRHGAKSTEHLDIGRKRLESEVAHAEPIPVALRRVESQSPIDVEPSRVTMALVDAEESCCRIDPTSGEVSPVAHRLSRAAARSAARRSWS